MSLVDQTFYVYATYLAIESLSLLVTPLPVALRPESSGSGLVMAGPRCQPPGGRCHRCHLDSDVWAVAPGPDTLTTEVTGELS